VDYLVATCRYLASCPGKQFTSRKLASKLSEIVGCTQPRMLNILRDLEQYGVIERQGRGAGKPLQTVALKSHIPSAQYLKGLPSHIRAEYVQFWLWMANDPTLATQNLPMDSPEATAQAILRLFYDLQRLPHYKSLLSSLTFHVRQLQTDHIRLHGST